MTKTLRIIGSPASRSVAPTERAPPPPPFLALCPGLCAPVGGAIYPPSDGRTDDFFDFFYLTNTPTLPVQVRNSQNWNSLLSDFLGFCCDFGYRIFGYHLRIQNTSSAPTGTIPQQRHHAPHAHPRSARHAKTGSPCFASRRWTLERAV